MGIIEGHLLKWQYPILGYHHAQLYKFLAFPRGVFLKSRDYIRQYRAFLHRLKQAREDAGLTQEQVARKISKPQSFISKCESGERRVDFVELQHLAVIYEKPLSFFISSDSH